MCGIAGLLSVAGGPDPSSALQSMTRALRHRGPDGEGAAVLDLPGGRRLGLAQTRLAIQDLSPAGRQPMAHPESGSWIVYNGEVYNHQDVRKGLAPGAYHSTGDTETVLRGWVERGPAVLSALRGMFAFGLYDGRRGEMWLVRDRLGVKPLYVSRLADGGVLFASEVRALLASGLVARRLHPEALDSYLTFGSVAAPWTLLAGVESVMPGECWRFDLASEGPPPVVQRRRYWSPAFAEAGAAPVGRDEALGRLRPVLLSATRLRMVADVPVGVFLSGGIDSSSVVAALAAQGFPVRTFSVAFGERRYDESEHARSVARRFGTGHTELLLRPEEVLASFEQAVAAYDQPSLDGLNTYFISRAVHAAGVKVALSGLGGDELFGGYTHFRLLARLERPLLRQAARLLHGFLRRAAPNSGRTAKLGAILDRGVSRVGRYVACRQVLPDARLDALLPGRAGRTALYAPLRERLDREAAGLDVVNAHSLLEISLYLSNTLLRDSDTMSMAHSLELREPLLDHELVETAAGLPGPLKMAAGRGSATKALLVDSLPAGLPPEAVRRRKMGFEFPWERWLRAELKDQAGEVLCDPAAASSAGLSPAAVRGLWDDFQASRSDVRAAGVLCLLHLLSWVRRHRATL